MHIVTTWKDIQVNKSLKFLEGKKASSINVMCSRKERNFKNETTENHVSLKKFTSTITMVIGELTTHDDKVTKFSQFTFKYVIFRECERASIIVFKTFHNSSANDAEEKQLQNEGISVNPNLSQCAFLDQA